MLAAADFVRYAVDSLTPADRSDLANFGRIRMGMSAHEVEGIMGKPYQTRDMFPDTNPGGQTEWLWMRGGGMTYVIFNQSGEAVIGRRTEAFEPKRPSSWERAREWIADLCN
jgi:hypothetical protein